MIKAISWFLLRIFRPQTYRFRKEMADRLREHPWVELPYSFYVDWYAKYEASERQRSNLGP